MPKPLFRWPFLLLLALWTVPAAAADRFEGVASCTGSTCHGATQAFAGIDIRQDEYFIWQKYDPHTRVAATLKGKAARDITAKLKLGDPASAAACTVCHLPQPLEKGAKYHATDGIGCESCHGGSERWLAPHVNGLSASERKAHGMTATWEPATKAALCVGCHLGDDQHVMTHTIMGAGHPPLLFELNTFSALEVPHWNVDADYVSRKGQANPLQDWAIGQVMTADAFLKGLNSPRLMNGLLPELAFFDCNACHKSMNAGRWQAGRAGNLPPGAVPLNDTALVLLGDWLKVASPELSGAWQAQWRTLHDSTQTSPQAVQTQAALMRRFLQDKLLGKAAQFAPSPAELRGLAKTVAARALNERANDFTYAESSAMTLAVIYNQLPERSQASTRKAVKALYASIQDRDRFKVEAYKKAVKDLLGL
jgi:hypothetical protein